MDIIFYHPTFDTSYWIKALSAALPGARVREWKRGDHEHVPPLQGRVTGSWWFPRWRWGCCLAMP